MKENEFVTNSLKSPTKYLRTTGKVFHKKAKPEMVSFAKDILAEVKPKIQKSVNDAASKLIHNAFNIPR